MPSLILPCPTGQVSDGWHTFDELYEHRCLLFAALMRAHPQISWRSWLHSDGTRDPEKWIGGMDLPGCGMITYHLAPRHWELLDNSQIATLDCAPEYDHHDSFDTLQRLFDWLKKQQTPAA